MRIICETEHENDRGTALAQQTSCRFTKRQDGFALTIWSVDDLANMEFEDDEERLGFLEDSENRLREAMIQTGWDVLESLHIDFMREKGR